MDIALWLKRREHAGYSQMVTDVHHRGTERTEDSQRALRSITHLDTARSQFL